MTRKFLHLAHRAASHPKCTLLVNNTLDMLSKQVEEEISGVASPIDPINVPTNVTPPTELLSTTRLKKKEVETKSSKRKRTCLTRSASLQKREATKKEKVQMCVTRKKKKIQRCMTRKKKNVQRYPATKNISDFSNCIHRKSFNCI